MAPTQPDLHTRRLRPMPYHRELRAFLEKRQPRAWEWFASEEFREVDAEAVHLQILKSTYRLEREAHGELYGLAERALARLGLEELPVTLYQAEGEGPLNAFLAYVPGHRHAHVVFEGGILELLSPEEQLALLGHELAHFLLWDSWENEYFVVRHHVTALAEDPRSESSHEETARLDRLYTEIFADRGGLLACGDLHEAVRMLVKAVTGLREVSAESYLTQADEIFEHPEAEHGETGTQKLTHPEAYIRARALRLWAEGRQDAEDVIARMVNGPAVLDRLDLLGQVRWSELTRRLIRLFLRPRPPRGGSGGEAQSPRGGSGGEVPWFRSEAVLAHARHFFDDFQPPPESHRDDALFDDLELVDPGLRDYVCYLLLDFIAVDRELEDAPIVDGFALADRIGVGDRLREVLAKDLRVPKRRLDALRREARREAEDR